MRTLVTGGASFIGSHLVEALLARGHDIRVVDDLSSGRVENLAACLGDVEFVEADLREPGVARAAVSDMDAVYHLAADHGGRGYVDTHQAGPASNLLLDGLVFCEAVIAGVERVVFASSGCVYPNCFQGNPGKEVYLRESLARPPCDADNMYGWAKIMGEFVLEAYHKDYGLKASSWRYFTVYIPRGT